jgi:predicted dinucleotide-binding enzyme
VALDIQAVLQAQRAKVVFAELPVQETPRLVTELGDALIDQQLIDGLILVHAASL